MTSGRDGLGAQRGSPTLTLPFPPAAGYLPSEGAVPHRGRRQHHGQRERGQPGAG